MTFPNDKTETTASTTAAGTALPRVEALRNLGDGAFSATVAWTEPTGLTRALTIEFTWFEGLPDIDLEHAVLDGDTGVGMDVAARDADALRLVLVRAVRESRASDA